MSAVIVWFRRDLRLVDNPALLEALELGVGLVPVFIDDTAEQLPWSPGSASRWWLHHSLLAFSRSLEHLGSRLIIRHGPSHKALKALIEETNASHVYWNRLYEPAILERDSSIKSELKAHGLTVRSFNSLLLNEPWEVQTLKREPYRVFTPFSRAVLSRGLRSPDLRPVSRLPPVPESIATENLETLKLLPQITWDQGLRETWSPGEAGASAALTAFIEGSLANYADDRDRPDRIGTSRLSPFLHFGEIGPRQVAAQIWAADSLRARAGISRHVETLLKELLWREFAYHLLFHFPQTTDRPLNPRFEDFPWSPTDAEMFGRWCRGQTGIPLIDAGQRELWHTGWMHNRVRMAVASFLTKNLRMHWLQGARWFWDTLVDADLASNTLGWQWSAGCGADAAPYFRIFNPVRQGERFDPEGHYVKQWVPEIARLDRRQIHAPWLAPANQLAAAGLRLGEDYPLPIVDLHASRQAALEAFAAFCATD